MINRMSSVNRKMPKGFTLVEVLIAMLLLAIGVMGLAGAQLSALKFNQTSAGRTQASYLANSIADAMRANKANSAAYVIGMSAANPTGSSTADTDVKSWREMLASQLPEGQGSISCSSCASSLTKTYLVTITVQWSEKRVGGNSEIGSATPDYQQFVMETQI